MDHIESIKIQIREGRNDKKKKRLTNYQASQQKEKSIEDIDYSSDSADFTEDTDSSYVNKNLTIKSTFQNRIKLPTVAREADRRRRSNRTAAAISTATL